jgi:hypothetical protein
VAKLGTRLVMGTKTAAEFFGARSPVRFRSGRLGFVVRSEIPVNAIDPNAIYCLRRLNPRKKSRELLIMSGHASPVGTSTSTTPAQGMLPVEFSRCGESSLKITTGELGPGEYAVGKPYGPAVFCFGAD